MPLSPTYGPVGRLGRWTATHFKFVVLTWAIITVGLGVFAPKVEHALSGAGWEATGSESVQVRQTVDREFAGLSSSALMVVVHSTDKTATDPAFKSVVAGAQRVLSGDARVTEVVAPQAGQSISRDGHTAIIRAGAAADANEMVRAADDLKTELAKLPANGVQVSLTGASGMWSDFNEANKTAMMKSELISWPVTLGILLLAFGSLVAAGLPLMLTILGLAASAGSLYLGTQVLDISIWAMNFALMFALALGIDYALFVVMRFRGAFFGSKRSAADAVAETMDTAGKAVLFSGLTVLISLSAVLLVPSPAFRSMALGIMLSVLFILAATLTLLPAVLAKLGPRVDKLALPWAHSGEHRSRRFAAWAERLWRRPLAYGAVAVTALVPLAIPVFGLQTGMPSIKVVPEQDGSRVAYDQVQDAFGPGAPGALQIVAPSQDASRVTAIAKADPGIAQVMPAMPGRAQNVMVQVVPAQDPSDKAVGATIDRLRGDLPAGALVGGSVAENHDLEQALSAKTPLVIGVVLTLGFLLLLVALQAPILAAVGVLTNLLAVGAAFGVARLIFQEGHLAGLLALEPQGFLNAWAPVFFFAMVFAISMDYTVFLLSSAKEHWDRSHNPREAMVGGVAHSGRVVFAAAAVMVAVFFTFALSGPLPPKEMGVILGIAVLLDAALVRLLLVPVALRLLGKWAWWLPKPLDRILPDVRFGHA
ncbi:RND superfamily putative drug exporter [Solirubrobacter pauli]|uniref:RND superfamily putative drug exporter n=1 Tax=Solirubrobacter pauli TaxID=166793 RepID=A0A660LBH2_9ACTN|nr:MMPL family transporter [Solirubrobacter pauli]RKQ91213.1 RND superfamily putative drug exporter [Solirubrobacter pauli]